MNMLGPCRNLLVWIMVFLTAIASAQTSVPVSLEMPKSRNPFSAYKSIEAVMAAQADLTEPVHMLKQIIVGKG